MAGKTLRFCGQPVSASQLELIGELAARYHHLSRQELTNTVCELLNWRRPNGRAGAKGPCSTVGFAPSEPTGY